MSVINVLKIITKIMLILPVLYNGVNAIIKAYQADVDPDDLKNVFKPKMH